jgi:hypothetical protein
MLTAIYLGTSKWHEVNNVAVVILAMADVFLLVTACVLASAIAASAVS